MTRIIFGLIFLAIGIVILLDNVLVIDIPNIITFWPSLLIIFGLKELFESSMEKPAWPLFLIFSGVILQLISLDILSRNIIGILFWPVVFIGIGLTVLLNGPSRDTYTPYKEVKNKDADDKKHSESTSSSSKKSSESSEARFEVTRIFSSETKKITSKSFKSGDVTIFAGELNLEFGDAKLDHEVVHLNETVVFGSITIRVPEHIAIETSVTSIFGEVEDHRDKDKVDPEANTILIKGSVIFGSIEIKSS